MPGVLPILFFLVPLLVLVGIVAVIVASARHGVPEADQGIGTVRRIFVYVLSLAGLATSGIGMVLLVRFLLDSVFGRAALAVEQSTLALGIALAVVGTPVWLGFWWMAHQAVRTHPVERRALARKVYLYVVLGGAALTSAGGAISFLQWALGTGDFSGTPPALVLVWGALWAYHWRLEDQEGELTDVTITIRRLYIYLLALFGLALLATGAGSVLRLALDGAYRSLFGAPTLVAGAYQVWSDAMRSSLATATIGGAFWWWHWHRAARGDIDSGLRSVYLYLFAILGGSGTVVASLSVLLYHVLQWFFGRPQTSSALDHFDVLPGLTAAIVVAAGVWGYHWSLARHEAGTAAIGADAARRVYFYLVSAVGLVTFGVGLVMLFAVFFGLISPATGPSLRGDLWRNPLMLSVTLLVVGGLLWLFFWRSVQGMVALRGIDERGALSRRVFIYLTFGLSVILTLVNLSIVLFNVFDTMLGGRDASRLLWDSRWSLAMLLTSGAVSGYYWLVLQEDRRALATMVGVPEAPQARKHVTVVLNEVDLPLVPRLEARLGYRLTVWQRAEERRAALAVTDDELAQLEQRIATASSEHVLVMAGPTGVQVIPYTV